MTPRPIGTTTIAVLHCIAEGVEFGFDIIEHTGLPSGTVYPALASLHRRGLVKSRWEDDDLARSQARPRRRYYRITEEGEEALSVALERLNRMGLPTSPSALPSDPVPDPAEG
jgi:DNA-binding PadR family transcriptional regulator